MFRTYLLRGNLGWAYVVAGDYERAEEELTRAIGLAEKLGTRFSLAIYVSFLAECRLGSGRITDALRLSREAIEIATESHQLWFQSMGFRVLAQALFLNNSPDYQAAEEAVKNAITIQQDLGIRCELPRSLVVYGRLLRAKGELEKARETYAHAIAMFQEMGMAWDLAQAEQALRELG